MKLSTRELATIAVFGTLWGISEISLGSVLKSLNIPFSGAVLAAIGLVIALVGRAFVPKKGSTLFVGVIAMLLKLFSLGGVIIGPMVGIFSEALVAEIALSLTGKPRRFSFVLAGALGVTWSSAPAVRDRSAALRTDSVRGLAGPAGYRDPLPGFERERGVRHCGGAPGDLPGDRLRCGLVELGPGPATQDPHGQAAGRRSALVIENHIIIGERKQ